MLDEILDGAWLPESSLPPEADLAGRYEVSRLTVREAIRILKSQGVVQTQFGRRNVVNPIQAWTGIQPIMRFLSRGDKPTAEAIQLIQLRRMIETGAAALSATRISSDDLDRLAGYVAAMRQASDHDDVAAFVEADLGFHNTIIQASGNLLLPALLRPLGLLLSEQRAQTSAVSEVQHHAIEKHQAVLDALATGDATIAHRAMNDHMDQTEADFVRYVLKRAG
jgi:DNA-binding FadR family transcriptional regulator